MQFLNRTIFTSLPAGGEIYLHRAVSHGRVIRGFHLVQKFETFGGVKNGCVPFHVVGLLWALQAERHARERFWTNIVPGSLPGCGV